MRNTSASTRKSNNPRGRIAHSKRPHCEHRYPIMDHGKTRDKICWQYDTKKGVRLSICPKCGIMLCHVCLRKRHRCNPKGEKNDV